MIYLVLIFPHYIESLGLNAKYIGFATVVPTISYGIFCYLYKDIVKFLNIKQIYVLGLILEAFGFLLVFLIEDLFVLLAYLFFGMVGGLIVTNNSTYLFKLTKPNSRARAYSGLASCIFFWAIYLSYRYNTYGKIFGLKMEFLI
ncbi:MFS transporter [Campylobacter jejuni]